MSVPLSPGSEELPVSGMRRVEEICIRFEDGWKAGQRPRIEEYLGDIPEPERSYLLRELLALELAYRRQAGETLTEEDYRQRFREHPELVQAGFQSAAERMGKAESFDQQVSTGPDLANDDEPAQPVWLGRYKITAKLGQGGFGVVYRGYDTELRRDVAIKVPHRGRITQPKDVEAYLAEARTLAGLDHPHIVPVYDVGRSEDGLCYVVSKFVEGSNLASKIRDSRFSFSESAQLLATVAEALQYAHQHRLVHRDLKPANILLDSRNKPYLTDFGLALKEEDFGKGAGIAGTPAYMSPEQANREGHLVDGRSDIFSLGVVFYELLTGRRPFVAGESLELLRLISRAEVCPPRQLDVTIPKELERICLKALAKRATERYTTAFDLADDLRHWLFEVHKAVPAEVSGGEKRQAVKIIPKGLRSFDATDADFFLELLPGPRDRDGLPESIRFWKSRIEEPDSDDAFRVGLIYGPSGCGKSSLVKAGLLPRLVSDVIAVYVEATAEDTETWLLKGLRKHCPDLPGELGLTESISALRQGQGVPAGKKLLIVLDQFEQWLHAKREEQNPELVQALRQCDGGRVKSLVLVRDDFWMATTRFMRALEIRLVEGENSVAVDLFDLLHARKVLSAFGSAYGRLPDNLSKCTNEQIGFLEQAVAGLAQDGKVISVRLALFAEMVAGKPWTPATLKEVGGAEGVGVTFLEETFTAATAPPQHRLHQKAAQAVLKVLLPEARTDIKGNLRSYAELLAASGYGSRPSDFDELLRILDGELRLITPTDPEGVDLDVGHVSNVRDVERHVGNVPHGQYYQLTHDYLVPSLRAWLTRKQKETRRGRAELRLADRAGLWNAKPESRHLPVWWEWANIRLFTRKKDWTGSQKKMMGKAARYHGLRGLVLTVLLALLAWGAYEAHGTQKGRALLDSLVHAETAQVPGIVADMASYRRWLDKPLREADQEAEATQDATKRLHTSLALLPVDASQVTYLYGRLLDAAPHEVPVIRDALAAHKDALVDKLWAVVAGSEKSKEHQRLRAAAALATYDRDGQHWDEIAMQVTNDLVSVPAVYRAAWLESFRPVRQKLLAPLAAVYRDVRRRETERSLATDALADYAAHQPQLLADLLMDADKEQFAVIYPKFKEQAEQGLPVLTAELDRKLPPDAKDDAAEKLARRQANAAVSLLRMNEPAQVWPLLKHSPDPRVRSYLIHRFGPLGADAGTIVRRLQEEADPTIRRALILSLGPEEFGEQAWSADGKKLLVERLQQMYRTAADPGLHAAAEWLLRQWHEEAWLEQTDEACAKGEVAGGEWRVDGKGKLTPPPATRQRQPGWYVNGQRQTMVVIPRPVEFVMGSASTEADRRSDEQQHKRRIGRSFAIAAKPVTKEQFLRFSPKFSHVQMRRYPEPTCPIGGVLWHEAAAYCNWLTEQEGIPPDQCCYETNAKELSRRDFQAAAALVLQPQPLAAASCSTYFLTVRRPSVTKLKENYLSLTGYRLPTEAEIEYATRAGALTSRYYGETDEPLLAKYGWCQKNSGQRTWPVGSKKPNDLGFFDLHGNVCTWCQERYKPYPKSNNDQVIEDKEDDLELIRTDYRVLRGGSFLTPAPLVRCALRVKLLPTPPVIDVGIRPARTFAP
jgi:serine/threonine protein kinase/formylglycine-generating enzyme required for sulfatase activity